MAFTEQKTSADAGAEKAKPLITAHDIVFTCSNCEGELVVDREGAGLECLCPHCGAPLVIPEYSPVVPPKPAAAPPAPAGQASVPAPPPALVVAPLVAPAAAPSQERHFDFAGMSAEQIGKRLEDLKHQLKENMSQDVEMRGHVNRATIELHRLQLRLKKLHDRQADIEAEIIAAKAVLPAS